jgi:hypothetical protein
MNLFKELVITAPVSARLQFGFNNNVIVSAVDTSVHKVKGIPIKANTYITLSQVDPETRKVVAQNEFNYWNLDPTTDFCLANFVEQMTSLASIIDAVGKDMNEFEAKLLEALAGKDVIDVVKTKDGAKLLQDVLQNSFYEIVKDVIGPNCPLLKCKLVVNKKGYLELGKVQGWILPMTSEEDLPEIDARELKIRAESLSASSTAKQVKPDELGTAKPAPGATITATPEKKVAQAGFQGL